MPRQVLSAKKGESRRLLDARPDRVDYRDLRYRARLVSLPAVYPDPAAIARHFQGYAKSLILDQGQNGSCTGFGLAATINYLLWSRAIGLGPASAGGAKGGGAAAKRGATRLPSRVSPAMLYQLARVYDEWAGEDYEGSSCRGAMKGWHRHGVCTEKLWPYAIDKKGTIVVDPSPGWQVDAALRPLGAYYRIDKDSIVDLQSAICEVGAIYVSAEVSDSWLLGPSKTLPVIRGRKGETGGHAFAIVGYTADGFIVQNSWGRSWGYHGFAVMTYEEWVQAGSDAWVATLGAPVAITKGDAAAKDRTRRSLGVRDTADGKATWFWSSEKTTKPDRYRNPEVEPWSEGRAYEHSIVLGNDGEALNRFVDQASGESAVEQCGYTLPKAWLKSNGRKKLAIYAHGGLNAEADSLKRIRVLAPYFAANGIYPLFLTWKTGALESITSMLADALKELWPFGEKAQGLGDAIRNRLAEARDRTFEVAARAAGIKAIWSEMKENAAGSVVGGGGIELLAKHLARLSGEVQGFELHLIGHSAGSILLGHLLDELGTLGGVQVASCTLYAPACTVAFANERYGRAFDRGVLPAKQLEVHLLDDERERADSVGPYGKSLLYLVSRALETVHKTPLLGLADAWDPDMNSSDLWSADALGDVRGWQARAGKGIALHAYGKKHTVHDGVGPIPLAHGSFDNDCAIVTKTLERIAGKALAARVEVLRGF